MAEMCLVASAPLPVGGFRVASKELHTLPPFHVKMDGVLETSNLNLNPTQAMLQHGSSNLSLECDKLAIPVQTLNKPLIVDVLDPHPESVLFSHGIAEKCIRHEKILHFLKSGSSVTNGGYLNIEILSEIMDDHTLTNYGLYDPFVPMGDEYLYDVEPSLRHQWNSSPMPLVDLVSNKLSCNSMTRMNPDGEVLFMRAEAEMKDILSTIADFYVSKNASRGVQRQEMVVPYFTRSKARARGNGQSSTKPQTATAALPKSTMKTKTRPNSKKKQKRTAGSQREIYGNGYSQVCESLLSVFLIKNRSEVALHSLKQHGAELPHLITQLSAAIAGTGLAVLFSVIWKLTCGNVPLSTTKFLNAGIGVGMVWSSFATNMLRDTIIDITKNANRHKSKEEEMIVKVERSVNEILIRAATVLAIVVFKIA